MFLNYLSKIVLNSFLFCMRTGESRIYTSYFNEWRSIFKLAVLFLQKILKVILKRENRKIEFRDFKLGKYLPKLSYPTCQHLPLRSPWAVSDSVKVGLLTSCIEY